MTLVGRKTRILYEAVTFVLVYLILITPSPLYHAWAATSVHEPSVPASEPVPDHQVGYCNLYPIALHQSSLVGLAPGDQIPDIFAGSQPGNFGWLTWAGSPSAPTLATSLTPRETARTYINPNDSSDHLVSVGDQVQGIPGVRNSRAVRDALDVLKTIAITVPVWDDSTGQGNNYLYHVDRFANVKITDYRLPQKNRISAVFYGFAQCTPPSAQDDNYVTDEDASLDIAAPGVLGNDSDVDGDTLSAVLVASVSNGTLSLGSDGSFTYSPDSGYSGPTASPTGPTMAAWTPMSQPLPSTYSRWWPR